MFEFELPTLTAQLPSEREGYRIIGGSSTWQQACPEVAAARGGPGPERAVNEVLRTRAAEGAERERQRRAREARWLAIAEGRQEPLLLLGGAERLSEPKGKAGRPPAPAVIVGDDGEELLSVTEAARRSGLADKALRARIRRGSLKAVKRDGTRISASALREAVAA